jgi:hypothetical protein
VGLPGRSGRPKDQVRAACRAAFDARLPRLEQLADEADAGVALKALDMLAKYGGLSYTEAEARVENTGRPDTVIVRMYDNGRGVAPTGIVERVSRERVKNGKRRAEVPQLDLDGEPLPEGVYRWSNDRFKSFPEPEE